MYYIYIYLNIYIDMFIYILLYIVYIYIYKYTHIYIYIYIHTKNYSYADGTRIPVTGMLEEAMRTVCPSRSSGPAAQDIFLSPQGQLVSVNIAKTIGKP